MKRTLLPTLFCVLSLQTAAALAQQGQMPLPVEEALAVLHFPPTSPLDPSPDGRWVAYTLQDDRRKEKPLEDFASVSFTSTGVYREVLGCDIWVTNIQTKDSKNLTEGKGTSWSPVWSRDGNHLAFYSDRSGAARLWVWARSSDELRQVSEEIVHPLYGFEVVRWSPDGRNILVKILPEGMTIEGARDAISSPPRKEKGGVNSPTALVYRSSISQKTATGEEQYDKDKHTSNRRADLALIEVAAGKVSRIAKGFHPAWYDFSSDGSTVAFTSTRGFESQQSQQRVYDLVIVSLSDARPRVVAPNIKLDYFGITVSWSPDGKLLSYITSGSGVSVKGDCFVVPVNGGPPRNMTATPHPYFSNVLRAPLWDATGEHIYLLSSDSIWESHREEKHCGSDCDDT